MRKAIAVASATGALLFGGAGIATAAVDNGPVPSSTATTVAQQDTNPKTDHTGLWGLVGLLGLGGLAGLMRRRETAAGTGIAGPGTRGQMPRA